MPNVPQTYSLWLYSRKEELNQENMNKIVVPAIPLELLSEINQKLEVIDKQ